MVINNTKNKDRLKIVLQVTLVGISTIYFKLVNIDEDAKKLKNKDIIYESKFNNFKIKKGDTIEYKPSEFTLPLSLTNINFNKYYVYNFSTDDHRRILIRGLVKHLLNFVQGGTFGHNPNSRVVYRKNFWYFY